MRTNSTLVTILAAGLLIAGISSCKKDDAQPPRTIEVTDSLSMPFSSSHYVFYSLKDGKLIPLADSASTKWDIGIRFATIIVNKGHSGPGNGGVIVKYGSYEDFSMAPETGYAYDTSATQLAINSNPRSPDAWYIYSPAGHKLTPKAGLFFVIRTAEGKYAKLEVNEVGAGWDPQVDTYPKTIIYKFRYFYQPDGSRNLKN